MDPFKFFLALHICGGTTALIIAPLAMFTVKGGRWHRRWGKIYFWAMAEVALTATVLCWLRSGIFLFLVAVFIYALAENLQVMGRWLERPSLFIFPVFGGFAAIGLAASVLRRWDAAPFIMVVIMFAAAFGTLAISFWPYMIPFSITVDEAAAPHSSLAFMFWGEGLFVFPLMLLYTVISYSVFRGKVRPTANHY